jgi:tetratricopeptide (TPR) repeat protein
MAKEICKQCYKEFKKGLFENNSAKDMGFCSLECLTEWNKMVQAAKEADEKAEKEAAKKAEEQQRKLNDLRSDFTVFKEQADDAYYTGDYAKAQRMYAHAHKVGMELVEVDRDYERRVDDVKNLFEIFNATGGEQLAKLKERASYILSRLDSNPDEAAADYKFALTIAPDDPELHAGLKKALAAGARVS